MKRLVDSFKVVKDGKTLDEFNYYADSNNHASIYNRKNCLFDGHAFEAPEKWEDIKADMKMLESIGCEIVK